MSPHGLQDFADFIASHAAHGEVTYNVTGIDRPISPPPVAMVDVVLTCVCGAAKSEPMLPAEAAHIAWPSSIKPA